MRIHVIHRVSSTSIPPSPSLTSVSTQPESPVDAEKSLQPSTNEVMSLPKSTHTQDPEKATTISPVSPRCREYTVLDGRPEILALITDYVSASVNNERLMVVACGPRGMMSQVRKAVAVNLRANGPAVEMHLESFSW